ncbi:MAG TPA: single-stranded-DNA-specific exonuclease RecJ [Spirochaetia bacterium]|nr:single-stranded-DNA-specific exonuclease RecJ [Spirochaetia bacterium]
MDKSHWRVKEDVPLLSNILSLELGLSRHTARVLVTRGIRTVEEAHFFFYGTLADLPSPFLLPDMDRAVQRLVQALERGERVLVCGDYDVDGVSATAIVVRALRRLGGQVGYWLPNRLTEGYGLNEQAVRSAAQEGYNLLLTVDNGTSAHTAVALAVELGLTVIVTDHHQVPPEAVPAYAHVNPQRDGHAYPCRVLAGAGVAWKLVQALFSALSVEGWEDYLELAMLGTVADVVPLLQENRVLVREGLGRLLTTGNVGLRALLQATGVHEAGVRAVAFQLAPPLNAAGRLGDARTALELLLTDDEGEALALVREILQQNHLRRSMEADILAQAWAQVVDVPDEVIVLASNEWHPGLLGIVASRLAEQLGKPVLLVTGQGTEGRGSGRSRQGFNLFEALSSASHLLLDYGGHPQAAGFRLNLDCLEPLRLALNAYQAREAGRQGPAWELDGELVLSDLDEDLVRELAAFAPYGAGNPEPVFCCRVVTPVSCQSVGKEGRHLKLKIACDRLVCDGIAFGYGGRAPEGGPLDLVCRPILNEWNGRRKVELAVLDFRPAGEVEGTGQTATESGALQTDLFLPESVSRQIHLRLGGETGLPGQDPGSGVDNLVFLPGAGWLPVLDRILTDGDGVLVLVSTVKGVLEFYHAFGQARPNLAGEMAYRHLGADGLVGCCGELQARVLICTYAALPGLAGIGGRGAVAWRLPYTPAEWHGALAALKEAGVRELRCLFGPPRGAEAQDPLPDREFLAALYIYLRKAAGATCAFDFYLTAARFVPAGWPSYLVGPDQVLIGLTVLRELELINFSHRTGRVSGELGARPRHKLDLGESATYRWLSSVRNESTALRRELLRLG